ncbi:MAG TPA: hypothetical protein VMU94_08410 [Streptosporangiaceae bacterium]|nr:hypothetical protein [Streptosporangiaceae bacterium]
MPGVRPGFPAYTVRVNATFAAAQLALRGMVCLHDLDSGELLALADPASITAWRTGLAAALGTHALADPASSTLGSVGAGEHGRRGAAPQAAPLAAGGGCRPGAVQGRRARGVPEIDLLGLAQGRRVSAAGQRSGASACASGASTAGVSGGCR